MLEPKTLARVLFSDTEGFRNFQAKLNAGFEISPTKNWWICFELPKRLQMSYFIAFFCLKGKLLEPKRLARVLFSDTEGLYNVSAKSECSFPNQPPRNWWICFKLPKRVQISNFIGFFFLKGKLLEPKTFPAVLFSDTEGLWKVGAKTECCFPNQAPPILVNLFRAAEKASNFILYWFLLSER